MMRQGKEDSEVVDGSQKRQFIKRVVKIAATFAVVGAIFLTGVGVGNGQIRVGGINGSNRDLPANLSYGSVEQVYDTLRANYDGKLDQAKLMDGIKAGLVAASGNPYTQYFNAKEAQEFNDEVDGSFIGIGAKLDQDANGNIVIIAPLESSPASEAGLRAKDIITSINNKSTKGMSVDAAVAKIRGKKDTKITLGILRGSETLSFTLTRDEVQVPSVEWSVQNGNIGYIQISQFSNDTTVLMNNAARDLLSKHVKGIVLDLRDNPGGLLTAAVHVASWWLDQGKPILQEKRAGVTVDSEMASGANSLVGMPTAVLINAGSASAAEIVAGALKDNGVATLYGEKSYGKGSVQQVFDLPDNSAVKITVARWYRPNGQNIDKKGIKPDVEVKLSDADYKAKNDRQKQAALDFLRK